MKNESALSFQRARPRTSNLLTPCQRKRRILQPTQAKFTLRVILLFQKARPRKSNLLAPYQPKRRILQPSQANFMLRAILPSQQIETTMRMSQLGLRLPAAGRRPSKFIRAAMTDQRAGPRV